MSAARPARALPYPLLFVPQLKPKVWGGRALERLGKVLAPGERVGESWELCDLDETAASGGGGGSARSVIANGPLAGGTVRDALELWGESLLGPAAGRACGRFPLLVKYLDARENLSVQVHPSAAYAHAHPDAHLKTEAWYILHAEPGSAIYAGLAPGVTPASLRSRATRAADASWSVDPAVVADLVRVPARAGDCHLLPSGTCHALGAGVLVAEVQTPSDTTFRLYDWGRTGRELHVERALECVLPGPAPAPTRGSGLPESRLASADAFTIDEWRLEASRAIEGLARVLMVVEGSIEVHSADAPPAHAPAGATVLIPHELSGSIRGTARVLAIGFGS